jgi:UDP-glucose 4-epimerase
MKVLITGGSGFIGTNLTKSLKDKHEVTIFDLNDPQIENIQYIKGDICNQEHVIDSIKDFDIVIHLAAAVGVSNTDNHPTKTLDFNIQGTRNVLDACTKNNIKKLIFSSSSEVYGEPIKLPISELDSPIPITTYGISKLVAEEYIKAYSKTFGLAFTILRFFNAYGSGQSTNFVIPNLVKLALNNQPITIHHDGSQIRSFCHIDDIIQGISLVFEKGNNEIFNIGNDSEPISIKELGTKIISMTNSQKTHIEIPFEQSERNRKEILNRIPSIEKAKKLLGYKPTVSLHDGIENVIEELRNKK